MAHEGKTQTDIRNVKQYIIKRNHTNPSGRDPGFIDRCIISSNWNVFEPGAAHTAKNCSRRSVSSRFSV